MEWNYEKHNFLSSMGLPQVLRAAAHLCCGPEVLHWGLGHFKNALQMPGSQGFTMHEMAWSHWTRQLKLPIHITWFHDLFILHKILWVKFWLELGMNVWVWAWDLALFNRVLFIYLSNSFCNQITWSFYEVPHSLYFFQPLSPIWN